MKPIFKKILIIFGGLIGLIVITLIIIASFFEKQVGNMVINGLNKNLKTELTVEDMDLSLLWGFPNASINLQGVKLPGSLEDAGLLLEAETLSLKFGLMSLFSKKYSIKSVVIDNGAVVAMLNKRGQASYDILKPSESTGESDVESAFAISLEEAKLKDIEVIYVDEKSKTEIAWNIDVAVVQGEFSNKKFTLKSYAELFSAFVETKEGRYLVSKPMAYDADIDVDLEKGNYVFRDVEVAVDENTFKIDGDVKSSEKATDFDLKLSGKEGSIRSIISLLPTNVQEGFKDFKSSGNFFLNGTIKGKQTSTSNPAINLAFGLKDGRITSPRLDYALKSASFTAKFSNGRERTNEKSYFEIPDFKGKLQGNPIKISMKVRDLDAPKIEFDFNGKLPLSDIHGLLGIKSLTDGDGLVDVDELKVSGYIKDMIDPARIYRVNTAGSVRFEDAMVKVNGEKIIIEDGGIRIKGNEYKFDKIRVKGAGSDLVLDGVCKNLLPVMLADSINSKHAQLEFNGSLKAKTMDFARLEKLTEVADVDGARKQSDKEAASEANIQNREKLTSFLKGSFALLINEFSYDLIEGENFEGRLTIENNIVNFRDVMVKGMGGELGLRGKASFKDKPYLELYADLNQIDIKELFRQCKNFGQEMLMDKHLKGDLDAKILVRSYWNEEGAFQYDKLKVFSDVGIRNGELIRFEMLEGFSSFVKLKDLRHIKFTELKNQFGIMDGAIYIPTMFIQSNALNMVVSGKQFFDTKMQYMIKVNAGQVLWNKIKRHNSSLSPKKAKNKGFINFYATVKGTTDDYDFDKGKKNYEEALSKIKGRFVYIKNKVAEELNVEQIRESEDWKDDTSTNGGKRDEEFDEELDVEMDMGGN